MQYEPAWTISAGQGRELAEADWAAMPVLQVQTSVTRRR
jgi:hypothetical protein